MSYHYFLFDLLRLLSAIAGFAIITVLMMPRVPRTIKTKRSVIFTGLLDKPNTMVGTGKIFDFSPISSGNHHMRMNTTYLNMMWHLGSFSNDNTVNTYFYIAFYIPPQHQYAAPLRRKSAAKEKGTNA